MAKIFDLAEGEVRIIPLLQYENGVRVRMLVTRPARDRRPLSSAR